MAFTKSTVTTNNIQNQPNQIKDQAVALKKSFDQYGIDDVVYINEHIDELEDTTAAGNLGATAVGAGTAVKVQGILEEIRVVADNASPSADVYLKTETYNKTEIDNSLDGKADDGNVLALDNTTPFTPDADYEPATKKYIDDTALAGIGVGSVTDVYLSNASGQLKDVVSGLTTDIATNLETIQFNDLYGGI